MPELNYDEMEDVLDRAIAHHGEAAQMAMVAEECCELAVQVHHYLRGRFGAREKLLEEMADVTIMLAQLNKMMGFEEDEVDAMLNAKIARLEKRLSTTQVQ